MVKILENGTTALDRIDSVQSEEDMPELMNDLRFSCYYDSENCPYEPLSEYCGEPIVYEDIADADLREYLRKTVGEGVYTMELIRDERVEPLIQAFWLEECEDYQSMTRQERKQNGAFWESTFTEIVNCQNKTLFVRFFEDDSKTMLLFF